VFMLTSSALTGGAMAKFKMNDIKSRRESINLLQISPCIRNHSYACRHKEQKAEKELKKRFIKIPHVYLFYT
jgi:hypothetical protein